MANSLGEGFVRLTYTGSSGIHHAVIPVNFEGTPVAGVEPTFTQKGAGTIEAEQAVADLMAVVTPFYDDTTLFGLAEVYSVNPATEERTFIYGWNVGLTGDGTLVEVPLTMATMSFKTVAGGVYKFVMMEQGFGANQKRYPPFDDSPAREALAAYIVGSTSWIVGRDNTYPFAPLSFTVKTSDALRKRVGL